MPDQLPIAPRILTYLDGQIPLRCHEHVAVVRRGGAAAARGAQFVIEGLSLGQWCCYWAHASVQCGMRTRLCQLGIDVDRHLITQTLQFPPEARDADDWLDWGKRFFDEAESAHAPAVRWLEEGVGAKPAGISVPQFFELHARLNYLVKHYPSVALCHYDCEHLEIPHLFYALAVHRHLLVKGTLVRDHPFYIPAEKFIAMSPEDRERDLRDVFREVGFDREKLLSTLAGYGRLQRPVPAGS